MFMEIKEKAGEFLGRPRKIRLVNGLNSLLIWSVSLDCCATFISPLHRQMEPISFNTSVTALEHSLIAALETSLICPEQAPNTMERSTSPVKIHFIILHPPFSSSTVHVYAMKEKKMQFVEFFVMTIFSKYCIIMTVNNKFTENIANKEV